MTGRILIAGLFHETHTFLYEITGPDAVRVRRGKELLALRGAGSMIDGFLSVAERENWQVVPALDVGAMPSGTLDHAVFEAFWLEFEQDHHPAQAIHLQRPSRLRQNRNRRVDSLHPRCFRPRLRSYPHLDSSLHLQLYCPLCALVSSLYC